MQNFQHAATLITEGTAMDLIFDACRGNARRESRVLGAFSVTFTESFDGTQHEACLRDDEGVVIALADVDSMDV